MDLLPMELLRVDRLTKSFGGRKAARDVSFTVRAGEVVAFLGPNGAGKSTTLRMIAGYLEPDSGDAQIAGQSILTARTKAQVALGYLAEGAPLYLDLTVQAFLSFLARAHGLDRAATASAIARVAEDAQIHEALHRPIETLSKGFRRRVALAGAIIHDPPVLVLDEPTDGLDPNQKQAMRALVKRMSAGKAILISTHQLDDVDHMCSRAVVINQGQIVADATPAELAARSGGSLEAAFHALTRGHVVPIAVEATTEGGAVRSLNVLQAVYTRELRAYFLTPLAYVFIAVFLLALGAFTFEIGRFFDTNRADLAPFFFFHPWLQLVFMPAIAMRLWADETRSGTLELILSLPAPTWTLVAGKFLAAWTVAALALALTFPMWMSVNWLGHPDNAAIMLAYVMSLLMAGGYLAVSCAMSALAGNQVTAFVLATLVGFVFTAAGLPLVTGGAAAVLGPGAADTLSAFSLLSHFESAQRGVLEGRALVFYLGFIGFWLTLTSIWVGARKGG